MPQETRDVGLAEKMYLCRVLHFYRAYLGIKFRVAVEVLNARRPANAQVNENAASEWYLWFSIGREAEGETFAPAPALQGRPDTFRLVNALIYEAALEVERDALRARGKETGADQALLDAQMEAVTRALAEMHALIEEYWTARGKG